MACYFPLFINKQFSDAHTNCVVCIGNFTKFSFGNYLYAFICSIFDKLKTFQSFLLIKIQKYVLKMEQGIYG